MTWHVEESPHMSAAVFSSHIFKGQCCVVPWACPQRLMRSCMEPTPKFRVASDEQEKPYIGQEWIRPTDHISKCDICSSYQSNQAMEPLIPHKAKDWRRCFHTWWYRLPLCGWLLLKLLRDRQTRNLDLKGNNQDTPQAVYCPSNPNPAN